MTINITQLVLDQFEPILSKDPTLEAAIPRQVEAQIALQKWSIAGLDDQKASYISVLVTAAFIPRLLLKFSRMVAKAKGGPAEAEFMDAVKFLEALQKALDTQIKRAAWEADPQDVAVDNLKPRPTGAGIRAL